MTAGKERFEIQAEFCKAMAHPVRLEIIDRLKARELSVGELAEAVGVSQANLSQHLSVLRMRGVVRARREGNGVVYALANRKIVDACVLIREILTEQMDRRQAAIAR
jgi:ArsR family transcriptional regulator